MTTMNFSVTNYVYLISLFIFVHKGIYLRYYTITPLFWMFFSKCCGSELHLHHSMSISRDHNLLKFVTMKLSCK